MKLTKLERHMAYMIMLAEAEKRVSEKGFAVGLCYLIAVDMMEEEEDFDVYRHKKFKKQFPELFAKKPRRKGEQDDWFRNDIDGWQTRISLLRQCITETEDAWPK